MEKTHITFVSDQNSASANQEAVRVGLGNLPNLKTLSIRLVLQWVCPENLTGFFQQLAVALPNLTDIDLSNNHLYDCDIPVIRAICQGLGYFRHLPRVDLGDNGFTYDYQDRIQAFIDGL